MQRLLAALIQPLITYLNERLPILCLDAVGALLYGSVNPRLETIEQRLAAVETTLNRLLELTEAAEDQTTVVRQQLLRLEQTTGEIRRIV